MTTTTDLTGKASQGSLIYVVLICIIAALGGLLFGYDTGVVNGAIGPLIAKFGLDRVMEGWVMGCALLGCAIGVACVGALTDWLGRKKVMIIAAILFFVSAIGTALPNDIWTLILFRTIGGLGIGTASSACPLYIAEITPARIRGRMISVNQFAIVSGILGVFFVNYFIGGWGVAKDQRVVEPIVHAHSNSQNFLQLDDRNVRNQVVSEMGKNFDIGNPKTAKNMTFCIVTDLAVRSFLDQASKKDQAVDKSLIQAVRDSTVSELSNTTSPVPQKAELSSKVVKVAQKKLSSSSKSVDEQHLTGIVDTVVGQVLSIMEPVKQIVSQLGSNKIESWNVTIGWRWMFGSGVLPSVVLFVLLLFVPESPRWLVKQNRPAEAEAILTRVNGPDRARAELEEIRQAISQESGSLAQLFHPGMRVALFLGIALATLQQVTGINVFLYFGTEIFKRMGSETNAALLQTVIVGSVNLLFTIVAIWTVDRLGRRPLMVLGSAGMCVSLLAMGTFAFLQSQSMWILVCILGYMACFALSIGPVTWVILAEIFPTKIRGRAMAIATCCLWIANYVISQTFPMMDKNDWLIEKFHHAFPFWLYGFFCVILLLVIVRFVPETKNKTLEEIEKMWMPRKD